VLFTAPKEAELQIIFVGVVNLGRLSASTVMFGLKIGKPLHENAVEEVLVFKATGCANKPPDRLMATGSVATELDCGERTEEAR
jgi:hypothetical protein